MNCTFQNEHRWWSRGRGMGSRSKVALICFLWYARPLSAADPSELLRQAERLADVYNWYDAHPLYGEAEKTFRETGDERNALYAQVSRLRGEMQIRPLAELVETIDSIV